MCTAVPEISALTSGSTCMVNDELVNGLLLCPLITCKLPVKSCAILLFDNVYLCVIVLPVSPDCPEPTLTVCIVPSPKSHL